MMINEYDIKILASLTGIVWLPFQAKYARITNIFGCACLSLIL